MNIFQFILDIVSDALFPISATEKQIHSLTPESAYTFLSKAPPIHSANRLEAVFHYKDERVSRLIWSIKYKRSKHAIDIGAYAINKKLKDILEEKQKTNKDRTILVLPIPITKRRRNERGYNQCEVLLNKVQELNTLTYNYSLLQRNTHVDRQTLKNRKDRLRDVIDIFSVNKKELEKYSHNESQASTDPRNITVIVVDDVITTGSTMNNAIKALKEVGFLDVIGIAIAH